MVFGEQNPRDTIPRIGRERTERDDLIEWLESQREIIDPIITQLVNTSEIAPDVLYEKLIENVIIGRGNKFSLEELQQMKKDDLQFLFYKKGRRCLRRLEMREKREQALDERLAKRVLDSIDKEREKFLNFTPNYETLSRLITQVMIENARRLPTKEKFSIIKTVLDKLDIYLEDLQEYERIIDIKDTIDTVFIQLGQKWAEQYLSNEYKKVRSKNGVKLEEFVNSKMYLFLKEIGDVDVIRQLFISCSPRTVPIIEKALTSRRPTFKNPKPFELSEEEKISAHIIVDTIKNLSPDQLDVLYEIKDDFFPQGRRSANSRKLYDEIFARCTLLRKELLFILKETSQNPSESVDDALIRFFVKDTT